MIYLLDVSHHQPRTPDLSGISGLIARATIGTAPDETFAMHIGAARTRGLVNGAYHFNWSPLSVADQVKAYLAAMLRMGGAETFDLRALDVEKDAGTGTPPFTLAQAREFVDRVLQATGLPFGLYHSTSGYMDAGQDWRWVADYRGLADPGIPWDIWQYGSRNGVDANKFRGTVDQLKALGRPSVQSTEDPLTPPNTSFAICDLTAGGSVYADFEKTAVVRAIQAAATSVPFLGSRDELALILVSGSGGTAPQFGWIGLDHVTNVRARAAVPADCAAAVSAQREKDRDLVLAAVTAALP